MALAMLNNSGYILPKPENQTHASDYDNKKTENLTFRISHRRKVNLLGLLRQLFIFKTTMFLITNVKK